jgi:hypothetical protein
MGVIIRCRVSPVNLPPLLEGAPKRAAQKIIGNKSVPVIFWQRTFLIGFGRWKN